MLKKVKVIRYNQNIENGVIYEVYRESKFFYWLQKDNFKIRIHKNTLNILEIREKYTWKSCKALIIKEIK